MGTASASFDPTGYQIPLARPAVQTAVIRYVVGTGGYRWGDQTRRIGLPNVVCTDIQRREGADPGSARFRYITNDADPTLPFPDQFEELFPIDASSPWRVNQDDRLLVVAFADDGSNTILFDGFAQIPEVNVTKDGQLVEFAAIGVATRLWDSPVERAAYRNADEADDGEPIVTHLPVRFNPNEDGTPRGNATAGDEAGGAPGTNGTYPVFIEPGLTRSTPANTFWKLGPAVRYLLWRNNKTELFVSNGDTTGLDSQLQAIAPAAGAIFDPADAGTWTATDIILRDYDATNKSWIEAVVELVGREGFQAYFQLEGDLNSGPTTTIKFYRKDGVFNPAPVDVFLQPAGSPLDPGQSNVSMFQLARDGAQIVNRIRIETAPVRYELAVILGPGFMPHTVDAAPGPGIFAAFFRANWTAATPAATRDAYRLYIFDECGDGHYDFKTSAFVMKAGDLSQVLNVGPDGFPIPGGKRQFVNRYRKPLRELLSKDALGKPLHAELALSRDYTGDVVTVWDGKTGHWQPISGGWELLKDRIGVRVTAESPEAWDCGDYRGDNAQNPSSEIRGVKSIASPYTGTDANQKLNNGLFYLRLTLVIEGDIDIDAAADRRPASPTKFAITREIDARDHYRRDLIDASSPFYPAGGDGLVVSRDDTAKAISHAQSVRSAHEMCMSAGSITIPRHTRAYEVGDRIKSIAGRDCSLRSNAASQAGEGPRYPYVVGLRWHLGTEQTTTLLLSDRRAEPGQPG